ncbi:MAG: hypothetical protein AVDCRST_MAG57-147, partial [uncultured Blastococcus sp.]
RGADQLGRERAAGRGRRAAAGAAGDRDQPGPGRVGGAGGDRRPGRRRDALRPADPLRPVRGAGRGRGEEQPRGRAAAGDDEALAAAGRQDHRARRPRPGPDRHHRRPRRRRGPRLRPGRRPGRPDRHRRLGDRLVRARLRVLRLAVRRRRLAGQPAGGPRQRAHPDLDAADRGLPGRDPGQCGPGRDAGHRHQLRAGSVPDGDAGAHGGGPGGGLGGRAGGRPHARGDRPDRAAGRTRLRRGAAAHEREGEAARGAAGRAGPAGL